MQPAMEHSTGKVLKRPTILLRIWTRATTELQLRLQGATVDQITQMDIFYRAMNYSLKGIINAACYGAFKKKSAEKANQLIEDLDKSNFKAPTETSRSNGRFRGGCMLELNMITTIEAKLDALMSKMSTQEMISHSENAVGIEKGGEHKCIID